MPTDTLNYRANPEIQRLRALVECSRDDQERADAVEVLARRSDPDACRALVAAFERCAFRATRVAIVRALGRLGQQRGTELLLRVASSREDYALASEAILALGRTDDPVAGELILSVLDQHDHPLRREAVLALASLRYFPCDRALTALLDAEDDDLSQALVEALLLSLGRRGQRAFWPLVSRFLVPPKSDEELPLFHSALIAAGEVGGPEALTVLKALAIPPGQLFAHELRLASIERLQTRMALTPERAVDELFACREEADLWPILRRLRALGREDAWAAFEALRAGAPPRLECLVRAALFDAGRAADDRRFLVAHLDVLPLPAAAWLVLLHTEVNASSFSEKLYSELSLKDSCALMGQVRDEGAPARLARFLSDSSLRDADRIRAANGLVAQAQMGGRGSKVAEACGRILLEQLTQLEDGALKQRLVRALGQIGHGSPQTLAALKRGLEKGTRSPASYHVALASIGGPSAAQVLLGRLEDLAQNHERSGELDSVLSALARLGKLPETSALERVAPSSPERKLGLLRIAASNANPSFEGLIAEELGGAEFHRQLIALAAARLSPTPRLLQATCGLLGSSYESLAQQARQLLATRGGSAEHLRLLQLLEGENVTRELALSVLQEMTPEPKADLSAVLEKLDELMAPHEGIFADREVASAGISLRTALLAAAGCEKTQGFSRSGEARLVKLDAALAESLPGYTGWGEQVKAALRHAELVYLHPELFDEQVDKSTVVVGYVKALGLRLQESLGQQLIDSGEPGMLARLQSRVVELHLHEGMRPGHRLVRELDCASSFDPTTFPIAALQSLVRALLSDAAANEPRDTFRSLRDWSLGLLLFARKFRRGKRVIEPVFKVRASEPELTEALAEQLGALDDRRNEAIHRGELLSTAELGEVRRRAFEALRALARLAG